MPDVPISVEGSSVSQPRATRRSYQEFSSVDGVLDLISLRKHPRFAVKEHGTERYVPCTFDDDWLLRVKEALGRRVVVEGLVRFRHDGTAASVSHVTGLFIRPEPRLPLEDLVGALPDLVDGNHPGDYVRAMREGVDA